MRRRLAALAVAGLLNAAGGVQAGERAADHLPEPGRWSLVPGSGFEDSGAAVDAAMAEKLGITGRIGPAAALMGGAAWNPDDRCLYAMGGGGDTWGGNEVYRLCLDDMAWRRITDPSALTRPKGACMLPEDAPLTGRSADGLVIADGRLHAFLSDGFCPRAGSMAISTAWSLDLRDPGAGWRRDTGAPESFPDALTALNPRSGRLVVISAAEGTMAEVDPDARLAARPFPLRQAPFGGGDVCTDAGDDVYCLAGGRQLFVLEYGPGMRADRLRDLGPLRIADPGEAPCLAWHPKRERLVVLPADRAVYEVDPQTMDVTRWPNPRGPAPGMPDGAVASRCAYDAQTDAFVVVRSPFHPVGLYRLPPPGTVQEEPETSPAPAPAAAPVQAVETPPTKVEKKVREARPAPVRGLAVPGAPEG